MQNSFLNTSGLTCYLLTRIKKIILLWNTSSFFQVDIDQVFKALKRGVSRDFQLKKSYQGFSYLHSVYKSVCVPMNFSGDKNKWRVNKEKWISLPYLDFNCVPLLKLLKKGLETVTTERLQTREQKINNSEHKVFLPEQIAENHLHLF